MNNIKFYKPICVQKTPCASDFVLKESHGAWWSAYPEEPENKFYALSQDYDSTDFLNLQLIGRANGHSFSHCLCSLNVTYNNLTMRDDGYGTYYVNYVDFFNQIMQDCSCFSRMSATDTGNYRINLCMLDSFELSFFETGQLNGAPIPSEYFSIKNYDLSIITDWTQGSKPFLGPSYNWNNI